MVMATIDTATIMLCKLMVSLQNLRFDSHGPVISSIARTQFHIKQATADGFATSLCLAPVAPERIRVAFTFPCTSYNGYSHEDDV